MNLPQHVTFTGVDEKTDLWRLFSLSNRFPIEWGILKNTTKNQLRQQPRYPLTELVAVLSQMPVRKALHLCGKAAETFQCSPDHYHLATGFDRIQVNRRQKDYDLDKLRSFKGPGRVIAQQRDMFFPEDDSIDYLFDTSGGRGEIPLAVPGHNKARLVGFAGGITPENVLRWIGSVNAQNYWIDMESGVRTDDWLDLDKCEAVCRAIWGEKL